MPSVSHMRPADSHRAVGGPFLNIFCLFLFPGTNRWHCCKGSRHHRTLVEGCDTNIPPSSAQAICLKRYGSFHQTLFQSRHAWTIAYLMCLPHARMSCHLLHTVVFVAWPMLAYAYPSAMSSWRYRCQSTCRL